MRRPVRVALVDDEDEPRAVLREHLRHCEDELDVVLHTEEFSSGEQLLQDYRPTHDLIFLDVQMSGLDGFETAQRIRNLDAEVIIIFVTHLASHAIRGYEVGAMNYLVKPVQRFPFTHEVRRALQQLDRRASPSIMLSTTEGTARVELASVVHLESDRHRIAVHCLDRRYELTGTMKSFEAELGPEGFYRINHGYLVNLRHVIGVDGGLCLLRSGARLQISRSRRRAFMEALATHLQDTA
ncbi:LytTR family DNA-binding domain-containing protein [Nesterenkonia rhizosphaerae]|uniref:LytR/AlgR family response regulator transcription factor n=1 Tax=Nesterenkonia rhizosphaerae TaxID=1348272 RepID=UPI0031EB6F77